MPSAQRGSPTRTFELHEVHRYSRSSPACSVGVTINGSLAAYLLIGRSFVPVRACADGTVIIFTNLHPRDHMLHRTNTLHLPDRCNVKHTQGDWRESDQKGTLQCCNVDSLARGVGPVHPVGSCRVRGVCGRRYDHLVRKYREPGSNQLTSERVGLGRHQQLSEQRFVARIRDGQVLGRRQCDYPVLYCGRLEWMDVGLEHLTARAVRDLLQLSAIGLVGADQHPTGPCQPLRTPLHTGSLRNNEEERRWRKWVMTSTSMFADIS
jgi:hypothetical protein